MNIEHYKRKPTQKHVIYQLEITNDKYRKILHNTAYTNLNHNITTSWRLSTLYVYRENNTAASLCMISVCTAHVLANAAIWTRISGPAVCAIAGITVVASVQTLPYNSKHVVPYSGVRSPLEARRVDRMASCKPAHRQQLPPAAALQEPCNSGAWLIMSTNVNRTQAAAAAAAIVLWSR